MSLSTYANKGKDYINGAFETMGGFFILLNIKSILVYKTIAGVDWLAVAFFTFWGYWNLFYYRKLNQWTSFWGGLFLAIVNTVWLALLVYYA